MTDEPRMQNSSSSGGAGTEPIPGNAGQWNDARWRTLIGFSSTTPNSSAHPSSADGQSIDDYEESDDSEEEQVGESNPDDDDDDAPQKTPAFKNPIYQAGVVGAVALVVFGTAGSFLTGFGGGSDSAVDSTSNPSPSDVPFDQDLDNPSTQEAPGAMKTEVALGRQEQELAALNKAGANRTPTVKPSPSVTPPPVRTNLTPAPAPQPIAINQPTAPPIIRSQPTRSQPTTSAPIAPAVRSAPARNAPTPPIDPDEMWNRLARTGSYGQTPSSEPVAANPVSQSNLQPGVIQGLDQVSPIAPTNPSPVETRPVTPTPVLPRMANVPSDLTPPQFMPIPTYESAAGAVSHSTTPVPPPVESQPLTQGVSSPRFLMVGSSAAAVLDTPVVISDNADQEASAQKYVVTLNQALLDSDGFIAIPQGAKVVAIPTRDSTGGVVQLDAVSILYDNQEFVVPPSTILITGKQGNPLEARRLRNPNRGQLGRDLLSIGASAAAGIGDELTRPDSTTSITGNSNGNVISSSSTSGDRNIFGAAIREGLGEVGDRIESRSAEAPQDPRTNAWVVPRGEALQIFVNRAIQIP
jgi:hypothetical protein